MIKSLSLILLVVALASCSKSDNRPSRLPVPTCDDSTDDGVFENWNDSERAFIPVILSELPAAEIPGYVSNVNAALAFDTNNRRVIAFAFVKKQFVRANLMLHDPEGVYYDGTAPIDPSKPVDTITHLFKLSGVNPGCRRLYYIFHDTTGRAVSKGHFDINIP